MARRVEGRSRAHGRRRRESFGAQGESHHYCCRTHDWCLSHRFISSYIPGVAEVTVPTERLGATSQTSLIRL